MNIRHDRIATDQIRKAVELWQKDTGKTLGDLYNLALPEKDHLKEYNRSSEMGRKLGKAKGLKTYHSINREVAAKIIRAIGRDPYEFDL